MQKQGQALSAVMVIKPSSTAKADLEIAIAQAAQITTKCCQNNIEVVDIIVTLSGGKDITKRVRALTEHKEISLLLIYDKKQVADTDKDYATFAADMRDWNSLRVISYR